MAEDEPPAGQLTSVAIDRNVTFMEPIQLLILAGSLAAGLALGAFYFGLLWLTVQRVPHSRHPALLVQFSLLGRMLVAVAAFLLVMQGQWERLVACLCGFLIARQVVIAFVRPSEIAALDRTEDRSA